MTWLIRRKASSAVNSPASIKASDNTSLGAWITKSSGYNFWEMDGGARDQWFLLAAEIKSFLDEQSDPVPRSVIWCGYMVGKTTKAAKPTAIFCSRDPASRKAVREMVRTSPLLQKYPGFITAERERPPDFGKLVALQGEQAGNQQLMSNILSNGMVYAKTPTGEWKQATIGGIVCIQNVKYYFTVAHIFTQASDFSSWEGPEDVEDDGFDIDEDEDEDEADPDGQTEDYLVAITSTASISPAPSSGSEATSSSDPSSGISITQQRGLLDSTCSRIVESPEGETSTSTDARPASEPTTSPLPPDPTALPVARGAAGQTTSQRVLLSQSERAPGLDYALLEIPKEETDQAKKFVLVKPPPDQGRNEPRETSVLTLSAKSAPLTGRLMATPSFITSGASHQTQELWTVQLYGILESGDCGMWVVDAQSRELYGHVVAGSPNTGVAYIIPAYQVFDDAKRHLGRINLPSPPSRVISSLLKQALRKLLPPNKYLKFTMVGLDAAGKTCLQTVLTKGHFPTTAPTIGFNADSFKKGNVTLTVWDIGGQPKIRTLWRQFCEEIDGYVFVVDVADPDRVPEAREELHRFLCHPATVGTPLLVLGNKCDRGGLSVSDLTEMLDLKSIRDREVACYLVSALEVINLDLVVRWLVARIINQS